MGLEDAQSVSDVQRLYMILAPTARPAGEGGGPAADVKPKARLIIIAKKVLPDAARHDRFMGFVSVRPPAMRACLPEAASAALLVAPACTSCVDACFAGQSQQGTCELRKCSLHTTVPMSTVCVFVMPRHTALAYAAQALADSVDELIKGLGPSAPRSALHI